MLDAEKTRMLDEKKAACWERLTDALLAEGIRLRQDPLYAARYAFRPGDEGAECSVSFDEEWDRHAPWENRDHRTGRLKLCVSPYYGTDEKRQTFPELKAGGFNWDKVVAKVVRSVTAAKVAKGQETQREDGLALARQALEEAAAELGLLVDRDLFGERLHGVGDVAEPQGSGQVQFQFDCHPASAKQVLTLLADLGIAKKEAPDAT